MVQMRSCLNRKTPHKVTVAHAVGRPANLESWYWGKGQAEIKQSAEQLLEKAEKNGTRRLEAIGQKIKGLNLKVDTVFAKGDPAEQIFKLAECVKAKLLLVGSKEFKGGKPMSLGGVLRKISRYVSYLALVPRPGRYKKEG